MFFELVCIYSSFLLFMLSSICATMVLYFLLMIIKHMGSNNDVKCEMLRVLYRFLRYVQACAAGNVLKLMLNRNDNVDCAIPCYCSETFSFVLLTIRQDFGWGV